ncbi:MAG TPA: hypothetical protein VGM73_17375 [Candidatus Didemnitutus sp.]|jgi:hypothetical protein
MNLAKLILLTGLGAAVAGAEVKVGDSLSDVRQSLGASRGDLKIKQREILYFERGTVELQNGVVTRSELMSDSDFAAFTAKKQAADARAAAERDRVIAEGEAVKARKLVDGTFSATPFSYQVAYWQNFAVHYPGVSVADELALARSRLADQLNRQAATEERLADLESRMDNAEAQEGTVVADRYRSFGYDSYGYYGDYVAVRTGYHRRRDESGSHEYGSADHGYSHRGSSASQPDYNPYRWNPPANSRSGNSFSAYPFGPLSVPSSGHHGRF